MDYVYLYKYIRFIYFALVIRIYLYTLRLYHLTHCTTELWRELNPCSVFYVNHDNWIAPVIQPTTAYRVSEESCLKAKKSNWVGFYTRQYSHIHTRHHLKIFAVFFSTYLFGQWYKHETSDSQFPRLHSNPRWLCRHMRNLCLVDCQSPSTREKN